MRESHASVGEHELNATLVSLQRRLRMAAIAMALTLGATAAALTSIILALVNLPALPAPSGAVIVFVLVTASMAVVWWRRVTLARTAVVVERRTSGLENLVVTAAEVLSGAERPLHPLLRDALFREAAERLHQVSPRLVQPLALLIAIALGTLIGSVALIVRLPGHGLMGTERPPVTADALTTPLAPGDLRVVVIPPAYISDQPSASINPATVTAIEGSRIRLEVPRGSNQVLITEGDSSPVAFDLTAEHWRHELTATTSHALLISYSAPSQADAHRLVQLTVQPDARPLVMIRNPGKDLMFGEPTGHVVVEAEARDDIALDSLALRFTRMSGSGETFTFEEGELPLQLDRAAADMWKGRATIALQAVKLADGDTLIYRAVAHDKKPGAEPAASESFTIEIGRLSGASSMGFALPDDRDRQGLSQQMLILKTERLHAERNKLAPDVVAEQSRLLAMEQRMVRAEFVFMTGGEVEDEVEEATHAHELAEGRLENQGQVELLTAIREMSRAEARLNAADTTQALVFERAALRSLQRAFDRRRYLLRTLPERTRIDQSRRLSGVLTDARSSSFGPVDVVEDPLVRRARQALIAVSDVGRVGRPAPNAQVAAQILRVDPPSRELQAVALQLSSARDPVERDSAARSAQRVLRDVIAAKLASAPPASLSRDPLYGRLADQLSTMEGRR